MVLRPGSGFTLIELLVAISILALIGVMSYRGLSASLQTQQQLLAQNDRWRGLSRFFLQFEEDAWESVGRPVRTAAGGQHPGFIGKAGWGSAEDAQLLLARPGTSWRSDDLAVTARVGYRHAGDRIERLFWPVADAAPGQGPRIQVALQGVKAMRLRFLTEYSQWRDIWPHPQEHLSRPHGVEVAVTLDSGETVIRFFSLI